MGQRQRRRPLRARPSRDTINNRRSIHDRLASAADRNEFGHWEADLIICKQTRPVLVLHERETRITLATRMSGKTAAETISSMMAIFRRVDPGLRGSVTFDNDTTFARHGLLTDRFGMSTWFWDAYASWQKGGIENANDQLRRWHPRRLDIDAIDEADLQDAIITPNTTPPENVSASSPVLGTPQGAWQRRSNPLLISMLRFALEATFARLRRPLIPYTIMGISESGLAS